MTRQNEQPRESAPSPKSSLRKVLVLLAGVLAGGIVVFLWQRPDKVELGQRALERGDAAEARRLWEEHLSVDPADHGARMRVAGLYAEQEPESAIRHYEQIPPESPHYLTAVRHVAFLSIRSNDFPRAETALQTLIRNDPGEAAVRLALAELYFNNGRFRAALPEARAAAELQPDQAGSQLLVAEILDELNRVSEMIEPLRAAAQRDPESYPVRANLAYALHFEGELELARTEAEWCLARRPDDPVVRRILAAILRDQGEFDQALAEVRSALESMPDDLAGRLLEADLLLFDGQADAAFERLIPLYEQHRDNRQLLAGLVRAAVSSGRSEDAARFQQELVALIPERSTDDPIGVTDD